MRKFILTLIILCFVTVLSHAQIQSLQTNRNNVQDDTFIIPESMNNQLATLLHDWQLDLTNANNKCHKGENVIYTDSVYMSRLYNYPTLMELSYNQVVKKYIDMYTERKRDLVAYMLTVGQYYFPMFEEALDKEGLPLELKYLPVIESALNPIAISRVGATGLWQFMLRTGQGYGLQVNSLVDERRDPQKSTQAAARYLKDLYAIYEDWNLVIAAYNCGPGNVNKAIARSGGKRDYWEIYYQLPKETRGYVPAFIAANYVMTYYDKHNICPVEISNDLQALDTIHVNKQIHFNQISEVLNVSVPDLKRWNPQYKKDIIPGNHKPYSLVLPTNKMMAFLNNETEISNFKKDIYYTQRQTTDNYLNEASMADNSVNRYYKVRRGDNLSKIANKHGITVHQLRNWNNLTSTKISVGKNLIVKKTPKKPVTDSNPLMADNSKNIETQSVNDYYRVRNGDNLLKIAKENGTTVAQIKLWNSLKTDKIVVGKNLIVNKKKVKKAVEDENNLDLEVSDVELISSDLSKERELNIANIVPVDPSIIPDANYFTTQQNL